MNTVEVLKIKPVSSEVLDAVKEVIPEEKIELVLIHHYMVHLERLWMRKQSQRLNTSLKN
jgi:hypothetical protein